MSEQPRQKPAQTLSSGASQVPLVPLSITPSIDHDNVQSTQPTSDFPKSTPSRVSSISRRVLSRNISIRNSRATSLITPVMPVSDDEELNENTISNNNNNKNDYIDLNVSINERDSADTTINNNEKLQSTPDSPPLPIRPPHTPIRPSHEFKPQVLDSYGMDRIEGSHFSPVLTRKSRLSIDSSDSSQLSYKEEPFYLTKERYLIQSRKYQIETIITLLSKANLTVSNNAYFEKIHASNDYIEVLSEIRSGSFESGNLPALYTLLLNSLKVKEDTFQISNYTYDDETIKKFDNIIDRLSPLLRSTDKQKQQFKNDLMKIYSVFSITNEIVLNDSIETTTQKKTIEPNAFVAAFVYRCASHNILPQALIVALLIDEFIIKPTENSKEFQFLLLRSIESIDPKILLLQSEKVNPLIYVINLINSNKFWCDFVLLLFKNDIAINNHPLGLTNVLHRFVIYGANSLIDVIINLRKELNIFPSNDKDSEIKQQNSADLVRFHREFLILNDSANAQLVSYSLEKLSSKNQELEETLKAKQKAYEELLHNYKQLNEEKISVTQQSEKLNSENETLAAEKRSLNAQVEQALSQFDVIKQTMEKNKRVQELNDSMSKEIERLTKENQRLRA